jgi:sterol 3beta-glucosyltransferase
MRLALLASGSRGDVQPSIALALGLQRAGYSVHVAANPGAGPFVESFGIEFKPLSWEPNNDLLLTKGRHANATPQMAETPLTHNLLSNWVGQVAGVQTVYESRAHQHYKEALRACEHADAVMPTAATFLVAYAVAEKLRIPLIPTLYDPNSPTRAWPSPYLAGLRLGPSVNLWSARLLRQLHWQFHRLTINRVRRQILGLGPFPVLGPFAHLRAKRQPVLFGFSPAVLSKPPDWPDWYHVTGPWFLPESPDWQPPSNLLHFLEAEPRPVYIGFGSAHIPPATWTERKTPASLLELVSRALLMTGQRAVVLTSPRLIESWGRWPAHIFPIESIPSIPFDWLFPRVAAVVHHGGNGTTAAGLRAGRPTCIVPFHGTQAFWGWRVFESGAGLPPIRAHRLSTELLADALQKLVSDKAMLERAKALGTRMRAENGVGRVVEFVRESIGPPRVH